MRILVADDELVSRRLVEMSVRRWGYDVVVASDGLEASEIMHSPDAPKLAVLDWMMPGLDGLELCRKLRNRDGEEERDSDDGDYTYILLLTGKRNRRDVIQGLEAGADDYIIKPFDPQELRVRLHTGKRILRLLEQLRSAHESLRDLAEHDSLTGLWNHSATIDRLVHEVHRAERENGHLGVAMVDLDHFKAVNDTHGHLVGDRVLCEAAQIMGRTVRPYDVVGRMGGEEFLIILPGCDQINAASHAERLRQALARMSVDSPSGPVRVTASIGVAVVGPKARTDAQTTIQNADTAMYAAKSAGRDRVAVSEPDLQPA